MTSSDGLFCQLNLYYLRKRVYALVAVVLLDLIIPDHVPEGVEPLTLHFSSSLSNTLLLPFTRWDVAHFLNIARFEYQHDYQFVFFPLYPSLLEAFGALQQSFCLDTVIIASLIANIVAYIISYRQLEVFCDKLSIKQELINSALFSFHLNPALIFFITCYTESLFLCCMLVGINWIIFDNNGFGLPFIVFASCLRSNGSLNSLIFAALFLQAIIKYYKKRKFVTFYRLTLLFSAILCSLLPSLIWNIIIYQNQCNDKVNPPSFCFDIFPNGYAYLQQKYWNVGFMRQYQWQQLPNLCIGFPILLICTKYLYNSISSCRSWFEFVFDRRFPWLVHLFASLIVCAFFAHVQVSTRILCASNPLVYIALGEMLQSNYERERQLVFVYLVVYSVFGMALHVNNFPWT